MPPPDALPAPDPTDLAEDGRHTSQSPPNFEWWYFDGLMQDGTVIVAWLGDNWNYGIRRRAVNLDVKRPGEPARAFFRRYDEAGHFAADRCDVRIGAHTFRGDLDRYAIRIDPGETGGLGCDLALVRRVPALRLPPGLLPVVGEAFSWFVAVPNGDVAGTITLDGKTVEVAGSGYHDHNWGTADPARLLRRWWWGRATVGERTVLFASLDLRRGGSVPMFFMTRPQGIEIEAFGPDAHFAEGPLAAHPDRKHKRRIPQEVEVRAAGAGALFVWKTTLISHNFLHGIPRPLRLVARALGRQPWYSRFESDVVLSLPEGGTEKGRGVLEYFEFR